MKLETEIKLRFEGTRDEARARIEAAGARLERERVFEENILYDDPSFSLARTGRVLRIRRVAAAPEQGGVSAAGPAGKSARKIEGLLTWKEPPARGSSSGSAAAERYKVRTEIETRIEDADALDTVLQRLGYRIVYRYQKYRTTFRTGSLEVALDETPIGLFAELEGDGDAIDAFASALGVPPDEYLTLSYRALQEQHFAGSGKEPGDMVFGGSSCGG